VIEALGATTVLCVDKTGTLTQNRMSISKLSVDESVFDANDPASKALPRSSTVWSNSASSPARRTRSTRWKRLYVTLAFNAWPRPSICTRTSRWCMSIRSRRSYWLSPTCGDLPNGSKLIVAAKGAPEAIADLCHMDPKRLQGLLQQATVMAGEGLRVLGVARGQPVVQSDLPQGAA